MPATRSVLLLASILVVAVTSAVWIAASNETARRAQERATQSRAPDFQKWNKPLAEGRCAISIARFGGTRVRLVRVETEGTVHYAVIESIARNTPMNGLHQGDWLRSKYGAAPTVTLGTYGSTQAALNRAGQLCPPALRCLPGRPGCAEIAAPTPSPFDLFRQPLVPDTGTQW